MSTFNVVMAEFASFEICVGCARLGWRYQAGSQKYKYCDGCIVQVREKDALDLIDLIKNMTETSFICEKYNVPLDVLYTNGIPVAYKAETKMKWYPVTNGWHKNKLEEYMKEQSFGRNLND